MSLGDSWPWWRKRIKKDGRFDEYLPRLDEMVQANKAMIILLDGDPAYPFGQSLVIVSPMKGKRLFIDFVYSLKSRAIARTLPKVKQIILSLGYEGAETIAHSEAHKRLYRRYFTETKNGFYIDGKA